LTDDRACGADDVVASLHRRENGKRRFQMIDDIAERRERDRAGEAVIRIDLEDLKLMQIGRN
jgi:hypothetical protein